MGADALDREGLRLADLSPETQARLRQVCPRGTMVGNPIDMLGGPQPDHFTAAMEVLFDAPEVDGIMVVFVPQAIMPPYDVAAAVGRAAESNSKPVVCSISGGGGIRAAARALHAHSVPHYLTPARAALGLGVLCRYGRIQARDAVEVSLPQGVDLERARYLVETATARQRVLDPHVGSE